MKTLVFLIFVQMAAQAASVESKLAAISENRLPPGARVTLTPLELNAYIARMIPEVVPQGVRQPKLELGDGVASGSALMNFASIRGGQGKPPGWLASMLLNSEHPVTVKVRIESSGGKMKVDPLRVDISGITIEGKLLDFFVANYLHVIFPSAKVGTPFDLAHNIDHIEVKPRGVTVFIAR